MIGNQIATLQPGFGTSYNQDDILQHHMTWSLFFLFFACQKL